MMRGGMMISVRGIGWLSKQGYGCVRSELQQAYEVGEGAHTLPQRDIFSHPFKNFGRLDALSRMTAFAVSLALQDGGIEYSLTRKLDIGIVGTSAEGSLRSDAEYFRDYLEGGRTLSRGNLFIYTLPSSPLGEAAIHFGCVGPLLYAAVEGNSLAPIIDLAEEMVLAREATMMLVGMAEPEEAVFFLITADAGKEIEVLCGLSDARSIVAANPDTEGMIRNLSRLNSRKR
jgi:3-oxoacyl-(acyl-carrier-protein) synthase